MRFNLKFTNVIMLLIACIAFWGNVAARGIVLQVFDAKSNNVTSGLTIHLEQQKKVTTVQSNAEGIAVFEISEAMPLRIKITDVDFFPLDTVIHDFKNLVDTIIKLPLQSRTMQMNEVVVSGTMKATSKLDSPVPVEVYSAQFFKANPTPSLFDALQNINGVRPQLNCNICNTGDIHINGLEGPYTMILIDGMPMVSGLASVYGLSGIPQSLIDRIEVIKGPASTLYGSEAVGGLINVITTSAIKAPKFSVDVFGTIWGEINADVAGKLAIGKNVEMLTGINYFNFQNRVDNNNDNFTDVTLQNRLSLFNKWQIKRNSGKPFQIAGRFITEDRWGGELNWSKQFRGGDSIYAESIYTNRWELFGNYALPGNEDLTLSFSAINHNQNSAYGNMPFVAQQFVGFAQLVWNKQIRKHGLTLGTAYRYTYYDDNTVATEIVDSANNTLNMASVIHLPGIFLQDEIELSKNSKLLVGLRYDRNFLHGNIFSPRVNLKIASNNKQNILRIGAGNGFRVANVFTEDHAALTGARSVVFLSNLKPETSWNANINFVKKMYLDNGTFVGLDATAFYTYFTNKIIADYDIDPNKIIFDNLRGYAVSQGVSLNMDMVCRNGLNVKLGATAMDVYSVQAHEKIRQMFTERFSGVWTIGYNIEAIKLKVDYTGNVYSPMRLPLLSEQDPRKAYSPWWSIQNIQLTKSFKNSNIEWYGGIKNLLNWTPNRGNPFLIARAHDPFDKQVQFDSNGNALSTNENPYGLTFDPSYVYGPNQGIRVFMGFRWRL